MKKIVTEQLQEFLEEVEASDIKFSLDQVWNIIEETQKGEVSYKKAIKEIEEILWEFYE